MIDRLTMIGLDRRALRSHGERLPDACAIVDVVRSLADCDPRAGVVVLSTCERFEVYLSASESGARRIEAAMPNGPDDCRPRVLRATDAAAHLLRVAAGLDSRLVGETHVLGQVRRAAARATNDATIGPDLARLFSLALRCGKRVRSETRLGRSGATYAALAARIVLEHLAESASAAVGVIGTGAVALEVVEALTTRRDARLTILGRHASRTGSLARHLGASAAPLDSLATLVPTLDALVTATAAPRPIVHAADLDCARAGLLLIDLGMPPNTGADARAHPTVIYRGLDDVAPDTLPPHALVAEAEAIVEHELARLADRPARTDRIHSGARAHAEVRT